MGRPEPCVLYAHTFVHPHLDEYVDEVLFSEPVFITACEFIEQNASSLCPAVKMMGATSPPSFALEVFIQTEGEARFRRLCLPYLYSHSSSNVLEVEAVVTSHLVVRGSYRSLSMVIYGNTAEDLGQFNIEVDLDSSLTETVTTVEGNLEDLPPAFRPIKLTIEELMPSFKLLSQAVAALDISLELRQFLRLVFTTLDYRDLGAAGANNVLSLLLSVASTYANPCTSDKMTDSMQDGSVVLRKDVDSDVSLAEAANEILQIGRELQNPKVDPFESSAESLFVCDTGVPSSGELVDILHKHYDFSSSIKNVGYPSISQHSNTILWLSVVRLLCSARESCFQFVSCGGMKQLGHAFTSRLQDSPTLTLLLLGVIEQATRLSIGCEGFLGWWPREDDNIPSGISEGYNQLLKLLLENQRHDVAALATYVLHRTRVYEVACRYEFAVLSLLGGSSESGEAASLNLDMLGSAKMQLKKLLKLLTLSGPIDDPSPLGAASRTQIVGDADLSTYKATSNLIKLSNGCFLNWDIDSHVLSLLKERGFLPLSAALLSSSVLRSGRGPALDLFADVVSCIEAIVLLLLFRRSGLDFLLHDPEVALTIIRSLRGIDDVQNEDTISLRYASALISKGFFCRPKEVGMIVEMHARALSAIDSLCKLTPDNEEFLWVLWDLCRLSRSECGRQALLVLVNFPEALAVLMTALHSGRELDPASSNTGLSPLNLAIFHSAAEIFEVVVTDSTATSLASWIDHAKELHLALHSSSPGSTKKDAPARLLQWVDASVVYHRNGATGLLRYAAVLASGGDAHMASNSVISSDMMDVDNVVGDSSSGPDGNVIDNLIGKRITEKDFPGIVLRDSSVAQLTTAFRILACISDNSVVAAALYDDGAVMVIHAMLINCKLMLERSSNIYDYLIDEGAEGNSTSDMLLERNREKNLIDLLIPSLVLLVNLLQKLQDAKEQHRNTKLMNALLQLHREVSPKLAACGADLLLSCPDHELGYGAVSHLLASSLACWPIYSWTPGLFHFLLDSLHTTSVLALGPKETCSLFCLLNDLFPDGSIWLWKNGMPMLSALRSLAVPTLLGSQKEKQINWYLRAGHSEKLLVQLAPQLAKLGEIIFHCAISMSAVIQDMLRVFIIRIACLSIDSASLLLRPIISWISQSLLEASTLSEADAFKVHQLLSFLSMILEHPLAKPLLLKEGGFQMFKNLLERCLGAINSEVKPFSENINSLKDEFSPLSWCLPLFKSISLTADARTSVQYSRAHGRNIPQTFAAEEYSVLWSYLLQFCTVLPVGRELHACLSALKEMGSSAGGRSALLFIYEHIKSSITEDSEAQNKHECDTSCSLIDASEWRTESPLLCCWSNLIRSINSKDIPVVLVADAISMLSSGVLGFCITENSINADSVALIQFLFGVKNDDSVEVVFGNDLNCIEELTSLLGSEMTNQPTSDSLPTFYQVKETANLLFRLLSSEVDDKISTDYMSLVTPVCSRIHKITNRRMEQIESHTLDEVGARFSWECPENLRERLSLPSKRKISALEGPSRRARGENTTAESTFSRGSVPVVTPSGPTRRDNFRQRKPNTSRPPSMHVDDYVARERNADGTYSSSNVIAVPRIGSSSGRPPSIHVDEFMARQRDRHNVVGASVTESKTTAPDNNSDADKSNKSRPLKPDLDDDLQGIDIVFDAEEAEPDDKLPFPQPDDILQQPASGTGDQHSRSIVEETEGESRLGTPLASMMDENTPELSSRMSASRPDKSLTREPSISSDKKLPDQPEDSKGFPNRTSSAIDSLMVGSSGAAAASVYMNNPSPHFLNDSRRPPNSYPKANHQQSGSHGFHDQKFPSNQPPLPPMPPPQQMMDSQSLMFRSAADPQSQFHQSFNVRPEYMSVGASGASHASPINLSDPKFGRTSHSSPGRSRPPPPLPPTPPPYSTNSSPLPSVQNSTSQSPQYFQTELQQTSAAPSFDNNQTASGTMLTSYPPFMQPFFRPGSVNFYGNSLVPHHGDNLPSVSQNMSMMPSANQFQPMQPQQIHRPPQHLRPPVPASPVLEQGLSLAHSSLHMQAQQAHVVPPTQHVYYQSPQQDNASQVNPNPSGIGTSQQQDPAAFMLEHFKSPEAIQALLNDKVALADVLERTPKMMEMLQVLLGDKL